MKGKIFVMEGDSKLHALEDQPYESEDILQALLENYPDLLAGDQMDSDSPRRWLLVEREAGVPDDEGASARWSIDHLYLDQEGMVSPSSRKDCLFPDDTASSITPRLIASSWACRRTIWFTRVETCWR